MKIMTNKRYDIICDIVIGQKKLIAKKEAEIKMLRAQVERLSYLLDNELKADNIDFPNSGVSHHEKDIDRLQGY